MRLSKDFFLTAPCNARHTLSGERFSPTGANSGVSQTGPVGGDLGEPFCETPLFRGQMTEIEDFFKVMDRLPPGSSEAVRKATKLGMNPLWFG